jgi:sugar/nucleoside kinase (ribokinase family)
MIDAAVISIGEILVDLIAPPGVDLLNAAELRIREGGAPANVAVALSRLGVRSQMRAVVGDDPFGERLVARLRAEGVDTSGIRVADHVPTTLALAWSDARGDGHFRLHRNADRLLSPADVSSESLKGAAAIVVGSVAMCAEPSRDAVLMALRHARDAGIPIIADLNIRPGQVPMDELRMSVMAMISSATVLKISVDDAAHLWDATSIAEAAACLDRYDPPIAVITDGARGAALRTPHGLIQREAFAVEAIEPTGAGDAFTAAFVSRMLGKAWSGADEGDLCYAMAAGAIATTTPGAMDGLPRSGDVDAFLRSRA